MLLIKYFYAKGKYRMSFSKDDFIILKYVKVCEKVHNTK